MNKKYIIEKKDLINLPESYFNIGRKYSSNYDKINNTLNTIEIYKNRLVDLKKDLNKLNLENVRLYNQLKFIKKSYVPKIYLNIYTKNKRPVKYVNLIINHFNYSKTIYLGKLSFLVSFLSIKKGSSKTYIRNLLKILKPEIQNLLSPIKTRSDFISHKFTSKKILEGSVSKSSDNQSDTFINYLKQFD